MEKVEAEKKKIIIGLEHPDTITPVVNADVAMVNRVIRNLLVNAIKYTDPGGAVTIKISESGNEILVSVKDTGRGIRKMICLIYLTHFTVRQTQRVRGLGCPLPKQL